MSGPTETQTPVDEKTFWERAAETRWGTYMTQHQRAALLRASELAGAPTRSLEVGCEGGRWSKLLLSLGWDVVCTDVEADVLDLCSRRLPEATCMLVDPADTRLPLEDAGARLLLLSEVAPVSQSAWFPGEAARVLEPGGILICTFYNPLSFRGLAYRVLRRIERLRHRSGGRFYGHFYDGPSYTTFRRTLQRLGFELLFEEGICWFPFSRQSDSPLIPACTRLEGLLGLRRLVALSPFVLLIARKAGSP